MRVLESPGVVDHRDERGRDDGADARHRRTELQDRVGLSHACEELFDDSELRLERAQDGHQWGDQRLGLLIELRRVDGPREVLRLTRGQEDSRRSSQPTNRRHVLRPRLDQGPTDAELGSKLAPLG